MPGRKLVASRFGGIIASSRHVASVVKRDFVDDASFGDTPLLGPKIADIQWRLAARRGNVLYITREVIDIAQLLSKPDGGVLTMRMTVTNQDGVVVMSFVNPMQMPVRPVDPALSGTLARDILRDVRQPVDGRAREGRKIAADAVFEHR